MTRNEIDMLNIVKEKVIFSLYRNMNKETLLESLNEFIYSLSPDTSVDLLLELCKIRNTIKIN